MTQTALSKLTMNPLDVPIVVVTPRRSHGIKVSLNLEWSPIKDVHEVCKNGIHNIRKNKTAIRLPLPRHEYEKQDQAKIYNLFVTGVKQVFGELSKPYGFNIACMSILTEYSVSMIRDCPFGMHQGAIENYYRIQTGIDQLLKSHRCCQLNCDGYTDHYKYNSLVNSVYANIDSVDLLCLMTSLAFDPTVFESKRHEWCGDIVDALIEKNIPLALEDHEKFNTKFLHKDVTDRLIDRMRYDLLVVEFLYETTDVQKKILSLGPLPSDKQLSPLLVEMRDVLEKIKYLEVEKIIEAYYKYDNFNVYNFPLRKD